MYIQDLLSAIEFNLRNNFFNDIYPKKYNKAPPSRRLFEFKYSRMFEKEPSFITISNKTIPVYKFTTKRISEEDQKVIEELEKECELFEQECNQYILNQLFNNYDYQFLLQFIDNHPELNICQPDFYPCKSKDKQCSFDCPIFNKCN